MTGPTPRTLVLLRHGKSAYPDGVRDHDRPLAKRGNREAPLAGEWLAAEGIEVDFVICSTAIRTRQTLERTAIVAPTVYRKEIYNPGTPAAILETIRIDAPADAGTVMVVGHYPGLPDTALTLDPEGDFERYPTSAYAVLSLSVPWDRLGLDVDPQVKLHGVRIPRD